MRLIIKGPQGSGKTRLVQLLKQEPLIIDWGNEQETLLKRGDYVLTIQMLETVK